VISPVHAVGQANLNIPYTEPTNSMFTRVLQATSPYNYNNDGNDWIATCSNGTLQSPIDIEGIKGTCTNTMVFDLNLNTTVLNFTIVNNGMNLSTNATFGTFYGTDINGNLIGYDCKTMAFHAPAEHILDSSPADLELQFFCTCKKEFNSTAINNGYDAAVVAIQFFDDDTQPANAFIAALSVGSLGTHLSMNVSAQIGDHLANPTVYYTYQGSLTAPPCTQDVNWYVVSQRLTLTTLQLSQFKTYWGLNSTFAGGNGNGNNRGLQSVSGRTILKGGIQCQDQFVYFFSFFILYIFINYFIFKLL